MAVDLVAVVLLKLMVAMSTTVGCLHWARTNLLCYLSTLASYGMLSVRLSGCWFQIQYARNFAIRQIV